VRLKILRTYYEDDEHAKVEKSPYGETKTLLPYYHVEVINIGDRPTTIMGVSATTETAGLMERIRPPKRRFDGIAGIAGIAFRAHYGKKLPYVVTPGDAWSCRVRADQVDKLVQSGIPKLEIHATCWRKPQFVRFPVPCASSEKAD
jgi:hypothetical protein